MCSASPGYYEKFSDGHCLQFRPSTKSAFVFLCILCCFSYHISNAEKSDIQNRYSATFSKKDDTFLRGGRFSTIIKSTSHPLPPSFLINMAAKCHQYHLFHRSSIENIVFSRNYPFRCLSNNYIHHITSIDKKHLSDIANHRSTMKSARRPLVKREILKLDGRSSHNSINDSSEEVDKRIKFPVSIEEPELEEETNNTFFPVPPVHVPKKVREPHRIRGNRSVIYIHGLFENSGGDCRSQPKAGPYEYLAAELAIKHINQGNVIPGYNLEMYYNDTKCDSGVAVDSFFYCLYRLPSMMMMLGTGSSEVTERLARVVSRWNIIQVSYGASSPVLSDRKNFPFFFRTLAPDSSNNAALLSFIQHYRWDTVSIIHEQGDNHALPMTKLVTELEQANISVLLTKGVSERDYKEHLQEMKAQDCRIIIGSFSLSMVRKVFCHVYDLEMFGPDYSWILLGDLKEPWWTDPSGTSCSRSQLAGAALGVIVVSSHYGLEGNTSSVSGKTIEDVLGLIEFDTTASDSGFVSQTYDAVWAMALALNQVQEQWQQHGINMTLSDFSYDVRDITEDVVNVLSKLQFVGISGPVTFYNSDRVGITSFHQYQGNDQALQLVCLHYPHSEELNFECLECSRIIWQGSRVPIARRIIILRVASLDRGVLICITSLAAFGVVLALAFLSFNLYFRRFKFIKLSSPNLNNFVVVGCILVYVAMILLGMDNGSLASGSHFGFICTARAFLLSGGFSLAFGCMFIKTYRVYYIFIRSNSGILKSKLLHDKQLLGMVSVLVLVDCFLVTLWVTLDPMERQLRNLTMQVNPLERNVVYLYQREQCYSVHMVKWLGTLYIYKGLLLVVGCYMAWETRHVKIQALNDSQYIGMSVYNVVITSVIVVALANVIPVERFTLTFVLVSALIFVSTTMTLCLLFLPKIHCILTNPEDGGAVVATPGVKVEFRTRRFAMDEPRESMYRAEVLNRALKRELLELEEEITRISEKMGIAPPDLHESKIRSNTEKQQEDDSDDDDLPPWLDEYKKYPPNGDSGVWYTGTQGQPGACFSVLTAVHPLLITTSDCSQLSSPQKSCIAKIPTQVAPSMNPHRNVPTVKTLQKSMRSSLPTVAYINGGQKDGGGTLQNSVYSCLSDRALNKIKHPGKPLHSRITALSLNNVEMKKCKQYSKSTTRLPYEWIEVPAGSLPRISALDRCFSATSGNTCSYGSEWTTAPLYSSSYATAPEWSSSDNRTLITQSETVDISRLPRDSLTDSSNGAFASEENSCHSDKDNTATNCHDKTMNSNDDPNLCAKLNSETNGSPTAHENDHSHHNNSDLQDSLSERSNATSTIGNDSPNNLCSLAEIETNLRTISADSSHCEDSTPCHEYLDNSMLIHNVPSVVVVVVEDDEDEEEEEELASTELMATRDCNKNGVSDTLMEEDPRNVPIAGNTPDLITSDEPHINRDQYEDLRHIFEMERDLILLELERSEAIDL